MARGPAAVAAPAAAAPSRGRGLDGLVAEVAQALRPALALAPRDRGDPDRARGAPLPRCSPASLQRALAALLQGVAAVVAPQSAIAACAPRRSPCCSGPRTAAEQKRDFLMIAVTHAGGLADGDQQRVLRGADTGPLGEAQRLVREMGGFIRFAPLPGGALETRVFVAEPLRDGGSLRRTPPCPPRRRAVAK